jgi:hypothetical protein
MKVFRKLLLVGAVGALFAACSKDLETADPTGPVEPGNGEIVSNTLGLAVSGMKSPVTELGSMETRSVIDEAVTLSFPEEPEVTRATGDTSATDAEKAVKNLWILQFGDEGKLVYKTMRKDVTASSLDVPLIGCDNSTVYAVANVGETKFDSAEVDKYALTTFEALSFDTTTEVDTTNGLPMIGSWTGQTKDPSASDKPKIELKRMVAKISFTCKKEVPMGHSFSLKSVQLCSVSPTTSYKAPVAGTIAPVSTANFFDYAKQSSAVLDKAYSWYVPENLRGTVSEITLPTDKGESKAPAHSTFIEVIGSYNDGSNPATDITFRIFPGANKTNDFNIARNYKYTITATVKGNNPTDLRVVVATDLCKNPFDESEEFANCYMVSKAGQTYKFDALHLANNATVAANAPKSVKVLWETNGAQKIIKSVELKNGWVYFTTAGESGDPITEGNAVIAVYDTTTPGNEQNVLWSWHIWSTQCNPAEDASWYQGNYKFMKYNLGADCTSAEGTVGRFGLYYQWGRKDPFIGVNPTAGISFGNQTSFAANTAPTYGGGTWTTAAVSSSVGTIDYAKKHPMTFITATASPYDWISGTRNDDLWGTGWSATGSTGGYNGNKGKKSCYDPCPPGYRVPPQDAWSNLSTTSGVFNWNSTTLGRKGTGTAQNFYPGAGSRNCADGGGLYYVGSRGGYWSSSPYSSSSTYAGLLGFNSTGVSPQNHSGRASGFSVRCVQNF